MPDYFVGYEIVALTKNFLITCADDPGARERAKFLSYTCEADLTRLERLFSTNFQKGETHDYSTWVNVLVPTPGTGNGLNYGFEDDESSRIVIFNAFVPTPPEPTLTPPDPNLPGVDVNRVMQDFARRIFVVELSEILMAFTGYGWDPGGSNGEGLSEIFGALFYPQAYYGSGQGPRVNDWLNGTPAKDGKPAQAARQDWVTRTEGTDKNFISTGCAILFINYLVTQLGHPLDQVIRAGGSTLAETYNKVTGNPATQAFPDFDNLIAKHVPRNMRTFVAQDNIFPLRDPEQRALFINSGYPTTVNTQRDAATQSFKVKPGLFCPEAFYDYYVDRDFIEASEYVRAFGFVRAAVSWTVEGTLLPAHNTWATIMVAVPFNTKKPDGTTSSTTQTVALKYFIADSWNRSALFIKNTVTTGNSTLVIAATAREAAFPAEAASNASDSLGMDIITFVPGAQLIKDRKRCDVVFYAVDNSIYGLSSVLGKLKNLPDPPHEQTILRVLQAAHQVEAALSAATHSTGLTRTELLRELRIPGLLMSTGARVSDSTLSRIKSPGQRSGGKTSE